MKKIIDGKRYDTETATLIAEWSNSLGRGDFRDCYEALYQTRNKRFFLHGIGGAMTQWSEPCGSNGSIGGEDIKPTTKDHAREWLERHDEVDAIESLFKVEEA